MNIFGKEIHFLFTVGAKIAIGMLDEKHSLYTRTIATAVIMSEQYENRKALEEPGYVKNPLTFEEAQSLSEEEFDAMCKEMNEAFEKGGLRSVEAEEDKKKEAGESS